MQINGSITGGAFPKGEVTGSPDFPVTAWFSTLSDNLQDFDCPIGNAKNAQGAVNAWLRRLKITE